MGKCDLNRMGDRFPCDVCGKSYLRKRHLQRHMRDECIGIPPRFSCELCPSRFRRKYHMVRHLTAKHNIPPALAQQATGSGTRNNNSLNNNNNHNNNNNNNSMHNGSNISLLKTTKTEANEAAVLENNMAENLSLRKDLYDENPVSKQQSCNGNGSPAHSGGACSSSGTHSPLPMPVPTYGLSGAITAIPTASAESVENAIVKTEPLSPSKMTTENVAAAAAAAAAAMADAGNKLDDDWKIKLSLQLISNSLLKERLINTMPFGTGYNNNN